MRGEALEPKPWPDRLEDALAWARSRVDSIPANDHAETLIDGLIAFHLVLNGTRIGMQRLASIPSAVDALLQQLFDEYADSAVVIRNGDVNTSSLLHAVLNQLTTWSERYDETTQNVGVRYLQAMHNLLALPTAAKLLHVRKGSETPTGANNDDMPIPSALEPSGATYVELLNELNELVGLATVKDQILSEIDGQRANAERERRGLPVVRPNRHMIFSGNPGTGKTTVARIIGEIYHHIGILPRGHLVEVGPGQMLGRYQGHNTQRAQAIIESALGGVLLIDEAYTLAGTDRGPMEFQQQVIDTLVKAMEDHRESLVVILTGYPEAMDRFIATNAGLESRIGERVHFPDYSDAELIEVFNRLTSRYEMTIDPAAVDELQLILGTTPRSERFGNARLMRNIFEDAVAALNQRIAGPDMGNLPTETLNGITTKDILEVKDDIATGRASQKRGISFGFANPPVKHGTR